MMVDARGALGVVTLACALAVTGCTPDAPAGPTPSPTPAIQTPTETAQERQQRLDYAAAEKSYRTFRAEYERVLRAGGAKEPTKVMKATAGGKYLAAFSQVIQDYDTANGRATGKETIGYVRPMGYTTTQLSLRVCEDGRRMRTIFATGESRPGEIRAADLEVRKFGSVWKVWSGVGSKVSKCD